MIQRKINEGNFKVISFDLQGTLSSAKFSDEFWLEVLPKLYSKSKGIDIDCARGELKEKFMGWGKYDYRYYSLKYWLKELGVGMSFEEIVCRMKNEPLFFDSFVELLKDLSKKYKLIIISTTTHEFIEVELGGFAKYFFRVYSTLDDLDIAGKPKEVFLNVANELGVLPSEILHVGDNYEMDVKNAKEAGCEGLHLINILS